MIPYHDTRDDTLFLLYRIKENVYVDAGTHIAVSGETGMATAPHLHLVAKKDGKAFDPTILLRYIVGCCK